MSRTYPYADWASVFLVDTISEFGLGGTYPGNGFAVAPLYVDKNAGLVYERGGKSDRNPQFVTENVIANGLSFSNTASINYVAPLFILHDSIGRRANFDIERLKELFSDVEQQGKTVQEVHPEDIMDYIYAALSSPSYRKKYNDFLKTDFPRVPRPESWAEFWRLVPLGRELRQLHLMKAPIIDDYSTTFPVSGDNEVEQIKYVIDESSSFSSADGDGRVIQQGKLGRVYLNDAQYFGNVPDIAWNFYIGGYQPAQKWLKDRKGRTLTSDDLDHYQRIIRILLETSRIMEEIG